MGRGFPSWTHHPRRRLGGRRDQLDLWFDRHVDTLGAEEEKRKNSRRLGRRRTTITSTSTTSHNKEPQAKAAWWPMGVNPRVPTGGDMIHSQMVCQIASPRWLTQAQKWAASDGVGIFLWVQSRTNVSKSVLHCNVH